jgi:hypothetical protein
MVGMASFALRVRLRHVRSRLGRSVVFASIAVIHIARRIQPNQSWTAARRRRLGRRLRRRCSLSRSRSNCRRWLRRCSSGSWCSSRCSSGSRCSRSRLCRRSRRIPVLYPLMPTACPALSRARPISPVLTHPRSPSRSTRRRLCHRNLHKSDARHYHHQANRGLHHHHFPLINKIDKQQSGPNEALSYSGTFTLSPQRSLPSTCPQSVNIEHTCPASPPSVTG